MSLLKFLFGLRGRNAKNTASDQLSHAESGKSGDIKRDISADPFIDTASANPANRDRDGLSVESAIIVSEVKEEYAWMLKHYPGYMLSMQSIVEANSRFYDRMQWRNETGNTCEIYFDVTEHFGRLAALFKS